MFTYRLAAKIEKQWIVCRTHTCDSYSWGSHTHTCTKGNEKALLQEAVPETGLKMQFSMAQPLSPALIKVTFAINSALKLSHKKLSSTKLGGEKKNRIRNR